MKKMIIVLLAFAMGIAAQAATITWGAANIIPANSGDDVTKYYAYLIDNSTYAASDVTKDTLAAAVGSAVGSTALVATSSTATTGKLPNSFKVTDDNYAGGDKPTYYMIITDNSSAADATAFVVSGTKSGTVTSAGALTMSFQSLSGITGSGSWSEGPGAGTPEPTSGLLMLLGGAMLALRRRRRA